MFPNAAAYTVLETYKDRFKDVDDAVSVGYTVEIPTFSEEILSTLCDEALEVIRDEGPMLRLNLPLIVIGDLHGNLQDLLRILGTVKANDQEHTPMLFLGDYVDRGSYSIEVIAFLLALKVMNRDRVFLLRGNHEFRCVNGVYGFKTEVVERYGDETLWEKFNTVFDYMALAADLNKRYFAVHGGLSPELETVAQIEAIQLPLLSYDDNKLVADLVWSDPSDSLGTFLSSKRGLGVSFGKKPTEEFLEKNDYEKIIRAHQCVTRGVAHKIRGKVVTVFSSSFYNDDENMAGVLIIQGNGGIAPIALMPKQYIQRKSASFSAAITEVRTARKREKPTLPQIKAFRSIPLGTGLVLRRTQRSNSLLRGMSETSPHGFATSRARPPPPCLYKCISGR